MDGKGRKERTVEELIKYSEDLLNENNRLLAELRKIKGGGVDRSYMDFLGEIAELDICQLHQKDSAYKGSWLKRGGVGAYMMLARKWDRIENLAEANGWDIFAACESDNHVGNLRQNDIGDLRRYLMLVEAEMRRRDKNEKGS